MAAMRDQAIGQPDVSSLALAEPTRHVRRRWIVGLTLASLGMWMANQTPLQVMLALQLQDIAPRHKIVALGVVTRGRGHRFRPGHPGRRCPVRPHHARRTAGPITQVLPKARDRAKDLGIINIAIVCPGAIGAAIAAPLVSLAGYPALFGATAVVAIAASIGVWRIKSVR
jgi:hypothetical protein